METSCPLEGFKIAGSASNHDLGGRFLRHDGPALSEAPLRLAHADLRNRFFEIRSVDRTGLACVVAVPCEPDHPVSDGRHRALSRQRSNETCRRSPVDNALLPDCATAGRPTTRIGSSCAPAQRGGGRHLFGRMTGLVGGSAHGLDWHKPSAPVFGPVVDIGCRFRTAPPCVWPVVFVRAAPKPTAALWSGAFRSARRTGAHGITPSRRSRAGRSTGRYCRMSVGAGKQDAGATGVGNGCGQQGLVDHAITRCKRRRRSGFA